MIRPAEVLKCGRVRVGAAVMVCAGLAACRESPPPEVEAELRAATQAAASRAAIRETTTPQRSTSTVQPLGPAGQGAAIPATMTAGKRIAPESVPAGMSCASAGCHDTFAQSNYVHAPTVTGDCAVCHGPERGRHKYPLKKPINDLCRSCHEVFTGQPHQHQVVVSGHCTTCHDPHAAAHKFLFREPIADRCATCHPRARGEFRHQPYADGACTSCHTPHEGQDKHLTIQTGAEHCYRCHTAMRDRMLVATVRHPPVEAGCANCHAPHTADQPKLLKADATSLCFSCHAEIGKTVSSARTPHGALMTGHGCGNCHDVHGSADPKLLAGPLAEVCLKCHSQPQTAPDGRAVRSVQAEIADSPFLHGPVRHGQCQACHQVHGSDQTRLLAKGFTDEFYAKFDAANYALCFSCHDSAAITTAQTNRLTAFRNGERNLHAVHVNSERGRTCRACHEIHGSRRPAHIAEKVPFDQGKWEMPIGFERTSTGGSCAPGCHQPFAYDREKPAVYPKLGG